MVGPGSGRWPGLARAAEVASRGATRFCRWPLGLCGPSYRRGIVGRGRDQFNSLIGRYPGTVAWSRRSTLSCQFSAVILLVEELAWHGVTLG